MWSFVVFSVILIIANGENVPVQFNSHLTLYLERGNSVDMDIGQEDQIYCKLVAPNTHTMFDGFGRCRLTLDRVGSEHEGYWRAYIGYSGRVTVAEEIISVILSKPGQPDSVNDIVEEQVYKVYAGVKLECMLPKRPRYKVQSCQFRGPAGQVLLASGSYDEQLNMTRHKSELREFACSVTIIEAKEADVGWWRCAVKTENGTYYTFMNNIVQMQKGFEYRINRTIVPKFMKIIGLENEPVTLSCSIDARIRYCYFKDNNRSIIPVFPGMKSSSVEYVGAGFTAGECGIKITLPASKTEVQEWSCNIGLVRGINHKEYQSIFNVYVQEYMQVAQNVIYSGSVKVTASTYNGKTPEYCRFMRSDGQIFTYDASPAPLIRNQDYMSHNGKISGSTCEMTVRYPIPLDKQPWIVFAKLPDLNGEVMKQSSGIFSKDHDNISHSRLIVSVVMVSLIAIMALVAILVKKRNRQWLSTRIAKRTSAVQSLLRRKNPPTQNDDENEKLPLPATAASTE